MTAAYPRAVKAFTTKPGAITDVMAVDVNDIQDEVAALEAIIGTDPLSTASQQPGQPILWTTIAGRISTLEQGLTTPAFSSWIGTIDDIATTTTTTTGGAYTSTSWGPWQSYGRADSPDNYPGGKYGRTPSHTPALEANGTGYGFEWVSQSDYVSYVQASVIAAGGEANGSQYRSGVTTSYNNTQTTTQSTPSPADSNGVFTFPKPPVGYDPYNWYNGLNGFVIKQTGWYRLTGSASWQASKVADTDTTRRLTLFGNTTAIANRDIQGTVGSMGEHKKVDYIGIIQSGTVITLGIRSFNTGNAPLNCVALGPCLSGVFLRGV